MFQKRFFLTGVTGFLGSNLAYELLCQGFELVFLVRSIEGIIPEERIERALKVINPNFELKKYAYEIILGNIQMPNLGLTELEIEKLRGKIDEVFHCAGSISFSEKDSEKTWQTNVEGVRHIIEFVKKVSTRHLHHVSTAYVVGDSEGDFAEYSHSIHPNKYFNNPYERTKYMSEILVQDSRINFSIYRPSIITGAQNGQSLSFDGYYMFFRAFWSLAELIKGRLAHSPELYKGSGIEICGGKLCLPVFVRCAFDATVNIVPIDWLVKSIARLSQKELCAGEVFHLTHHNPPNVRWLITTSLDILGITGTQFVNPDNKVRHENKILDEIQQAIDRGIEDYIPYVTQRHNFLNFNTRAALNSQYVAPPLIDCDYLSKILTYATRRKFKRHKERI